MIIVDLDDTLIDTRSTLRLLKLRDAARLAPRTEDYVLARAHERRSARDIIRDACALFEIDEETESMMIAEYYEHHPRDPQVPLIRGVSEALESFTMRGERIVCVTAGVEEQQQAKINAAGLAEVLDQVIVVAEPQDKGLVYADLSERYDPSTIIVIGDKLEDVLPAAQLGLHAILFAEPLDAWDGPSATDWERVQALVLGLRNGS